MRVVLVGLGALVAIGCSHPTLSMKPEPRSFTESSYPAVYEAWTRSKEDFAWGELQHVLKVSATFESWEFRWAYVVRYAHDFNLPPETRTEMLQAELGQAKDEHRFFVTLAGHNFRESDISGRHSAWRVLLIDPDGGQTIPILLERIRRPSAADKVYFPHVSPQRETFRISFPASDDDGRPTIAPDARFAILRFAGPYGQVDLQWDLSP